MEYKDVGTPEQPLHLKMPDGSWRTFKGNAGTPLKQKQSDGTWKEVAWSEELPYGGCVDGLMTIRLTFDNFNADPLPVSSTKNFAYGDVINGGELLLANESEAFVRPHTFLATKTTIYGITARPVFNKTLISDNQFVKADVVYQGHAVNFGSGGVVLWPLQDYINDPDRSRTIPNSLGHFEVPEGDWFNYSGRFSKASYWNNQSGNTGLKLFNLAKTGAPVFMLDEGDSKSTAAGYDNITELSQLYVDFTVTCNT